MRIVVIGPGDVNKHAKLLARHGKIKSEDAYWKRADVVVDKLKGKEIILLPDDGLPFEIAYRAKERFGDKVTTYAAVPWDDKEFGTDHLRPQLNAITNNGRRVFDHVINTGTWRDQHFVFGLLGDAILYLGNTPGTFYELGNAYYLYKILFGRKKGVKVKPTSIHPEVRAHLPKKFITYYYAPFLVDPLPREIVAHIRDMGGDVVKF